MSASLSTRSPRAASRTRKSHPQAGRGGITRVVLIVVAALAVAVGLLAGRMSI